mmetsp:Transcript_11500/g.36458  ORF Transcript_11500/g.36458 Transcript_11500/m.36458 type:complete len:288 (-) Transcript_11500:92-955(-)
MRRPQGCPRRHRPLPGQSLVLPDAAGGLPGWCVVASHRRVPLPQLRPRWPVHRSHLAGQPGREGKVRVAARRPPVPLSQRVLLLAALLCGGGLRAVQRRLELRLGRSRPEDPRAPRFDLQAEGCQHGGVSGGGAVARGKRRRVVGRVSHRRHGGAVRPLRLSGPHLERRDLRLEPAPLQRCSSRGEQRLGGEQALLLQPRRADERLLLVKQARALRLQRRDGVRLELQRRLHGPQLAHLLQQPLLRRSLRLERLLLLPPLQQRGRRLVPRRLGYLPRRPPASVAEQH